jgi:putative heme-binding domain-containing protein
MRAAAFLLLIAAAASAVTPPAEITVPAGFKVELLREAGPRDGSFISMTQDTAGRLYISPQGAIPESGFAKGSGWGGIVRVTLDGNKIAAWQKVPVPIGDSMGMLWAFDSLYVSGMGPEGRGIYRCKDTDGDSLPDTAVLWKAIPGGAGEHGAHALRLGPDGKSIYIIHGNATGLIDNLSPDSPYRGFGEDDLIPKLRDPVATFFDKIKSPYGYLLRTDERGEKWQLLAGGMRNAYDIAFNPDGELFTYDSDMEWDRGLPWYRPTRVLHLVPGGDYGFREGSAKMPSYYPDTLPAVCDIGVGCPTGVEFGTRARFPERYQRALYICDWTYGRILAVHMKEKGASYTAAHVLKSTTFPKDAEASGDVETFLSGKALPITDIEIGKDGAMYMTTGGRGTLAALYRISYEGKNTPKQATPAPEGQGKLAGGEASKASATTGSPAKTIPAPDGAAGAASKETSIESKLRALVTLLESDPLKTSNTFGMEAANFPELLGDSFVFHYMVHAWELMAAKGKLKRPLNAKTLPPDMLKEVQEAHTKAGGKLDAASLIAHSNFIRLLGAARIAPANAQSEILEALKSFPLKDLPNDLKLLKLRILELSFARQGRPSEEWQKVGLEKLLGSYPAQGAEAAKLNRELCQLLVWLSQPELGALNADLVAAKGKDEGDDGENKPKQKNGASIQEKISPSLWAFIQSKQTIMSSQWTLVQCGMILMQQGTAFSLKGTILKVQGTIMKQKGTLECRERVSDEPAIPCQSPAPPMEARSPRPIFDPVPNPGAEVFPGRKGAAFHAELGRQVIEKTLLLMEKAPSQEEQIQYALYLRWAHGWSKEQRERYFRWFHEKAARYTGGNSFRKFIEKMHSEAAGRVPAAERAGLEKWLSPMSAPVSATPAKPRAFVKAWSLAELEAALDALKARKPDAARGAELYAGAQCAQCHLFRDSGGNAGPDLSAVAQRFGRRDILEAITDPNKVVSDQYALTTLKVIKFGGGEEDVTGLVQEESSGVIRILTDPLAGTAREFYHNVVKGKQKAAVSLMPPGLLNTLSAEEVADLLAFLGAR